MTTDSGYNVHDYIHFDTERTYYAVTDEELAMLNEAGQNLWKDVCLVSVALGIPCLINAVAATTNPFTLTLALFLNYLFGALGIILGIIFGIAWYRTHDEAKSLVERIRRKPRMEIGRGPFFDVATSPSVSLASRESGDTGKGAKS